MDRPYVDPQEIRLEIPPEPPEPPDTQPEGPVPAPEWDPAELLAAHPYPATDVPLWSSPAVPARDWIVDATVLAAAAPPILLLARNERRRRALIRWMGATSTDARLGPREADATPQLGYPLPPLAELEILHGGEVWASSVAGGPISWLVELESVT